MAQSGATGLSGTPGQVNVTLTIGAPGPPGVTHPGASGPPPNLPFTGIPVAAEIDAGLLIAVTGALVVRLVSITADGTLGLLGLRRRAPGGRAS